MYWIQLYFVIGLGMSMICISELGKTINGSRCFGCIIILVVAWLPVIIALLIKFILTKDKDKFSA